VRSLSATIILLTVGTLGGIAVVTTYPPHRRQDAAATYPPAAQVGYTATSLPPVVITVEDEADRVARAPNRAHDIGAVACGYPRAACPGHRVHIPPQSWNAYQTIDGMRYCDDADHLYPLRHEHREERGR